ncbi:hypothetical protein LAZ67_3005909 [Cordylochernes scorpioides]|uniref:Uncharacterized protein n=1 Tax=Cordylochernes scorpioides TaxID=51811 RepID=A0ABY6KBT4_9ARAC|nr:hypothetical protein LAZ67_3005909 [Cordylochernes scorpioides]
MEEQTSRHLLIDCPAFQDYRMKNELSTLTNAFETINPHIILHNKFKLGMLSAQEATSAGLQDFVSAIPASRIVDEG